MKQIEKQLEAILNERDNQVFWLNGFIDRIKEYLEVEVSEGKPIVEDRNSPFMAHEDYQILKGRLEFAEGLLSEIEKWEQED